MDDLWQLGKARGSGGPWRESAVKANEPSDPYLIAGYAKRRVALTNAGSESVSFRVEADVSGTAQWLSYRAFEVAAGQTVNYAFPSAFGAYWVRIVSSADTTASAIFTYE